MSTAYNVSASLPTLSSKFMTVYYRMVEDLLRTSPIHTGEWQTLDTRRSPYHATHEITDVTIRYDVPLYLTDLKEDVQPDLPWAEDHFFERASMQPLNPPPSAARWPWAVRSNADHLRVLDDAGDTLGDIPRFDHTYPERYWPKQANVTCPSPEECMSDCIHLKLNRHHGIRFDYGDLSDVVNLLIRSPLTRQAYLPVWFPEDTGAVLGQRVPCTLGYHFMIRRDMLNCWYYIRSCDILRHFRNDVYLTARLMQWVADLVRAQAKSRDVFHLLPGQMVMVISSLHAFTGDVPKLNGILDGNPLVA